MSTGGSSALRYPSWSIPAVGRISSAGAALPHKEDVLPSVLPPWAMETRHEPGHHFACLSVEAGVARSGDPVGHSGLQRPVLGLADERSNLDRPDRAQGGGLEQVEPSLGQEDVAPA